jgi:hypothetical protein
MTLEIQNFLRQAVIDLDLPTGVPNVALNGLESASRQPLDVSSAHIQADQTKVLH